MATPETVPESPVVEVLTSVTPQDVEDFQRLLPQLSSRELPAPDVIEARLLAAANPDNEDSRVFVIRDQGRIQASATGNICRIPTGEKPWIDDVVTDEAYRGRGFGRQLMEALHDWFEERGVSSVNLTSSPSRGAAGSLYENMGYRQLDTRVYRKYLGRAAVSGSM
jgi:GNAT superfamily N-acetyltransferase